MKDNFNFELISPEKIVFSGEVKMVILPAYEGDMGLLKNHISIITFLKPGIIKIEKNDGNFDEFFVQDGTAEYSNDNLIVLSISAVNIKKISKDYIDNLKKETETKIAGKNVTDHDLYILNHKLDVLKEINI